jgi:hypothetical protein
MTCPKITYFSTDPITLIYIILIVINLSLVIFALMTRESFTNLHENYSELPDEAFELFSI